MSRLPANSEQAARKIASEMAPFVLGQVGVRKMRRLFGRNPALTHAEWQMAKRAGVGDEYKKLGQVKARIHAHLNRTRTLGKLAQAAINAKSVITRQKRVEKLVTAIMDGGQPRGVPHADNELENSFQDIISGADPQLSDDMRPHEPFSHGGNIAIADGDADEIASLPSVQQWYEEIIDVLARIDSLRAAYIDLYKENNNDPMSGNVRSRLGAIAKRQMRTQPRCGPGTIAVVTDAGNNEVVPSKLADAVLMDLQGNLVLKEGHKIACKRGLPLGRSGFSFNTMVVPFKASSARKRCRGSACSVAGNRKSSCRSAYYKTRDVAIVPLPSKTKGGIRLAVKRIYANGKAHVIRHEKKYIAVPSSATIVRNIAKVCTASAKARISAAKKAIRAKHSAVRKAARAAARKQKRKAAAKAKKAKKAKKPKKKAAPKAKKAKKPKKKAASKKKKKPSASASASGPRRSSRARKAPKRFSAPSFYLF